MQSHTTTPEGDSLDREKQAGVDKRPSQGSNRSKAGIPSGQTSKWTVLFIVAIGVFMATLDSSIVNISLPAIARYFAVAVDGAVEWVIIAYLVVIASVLLTIGRLADMVGRKPIWATGLVIFTLGSAISGAAPSLGILVAARAFQGLGGALLMAISPAMLTTAFPPSERGRALGLNALVVALGVSAGPTIGGILTQYFTWRAIFYVNVPLGIVGFIATIILLKSNVARARGRFDPAGAILLGIGLASLTLGLSFGQQWGWMSGRVIISVVVAVVALVALVLVEMKIPDPIVDIVLLKDRVFASANLSLVLSFLALFAVSFLLPFYLEQSRGFSTIESGFLLTPLPLTIAVIAPFSGTLADRIGTRWLAAFGLAIACVGLILLSELNASRSVFDIVWRLCVTGLGQGLFQSPNNSALMGAAPRNRQGIAAGFLATGRVIGQSVSVALAGAVFAAYGGAAAGLQLTNQQYGHTGSQASTAALQQSFQSGFHAALMVCAVIAAIGVFASLVRGKESLER